METLVRSWSLVVAIASRHMRQVSGRFSHAANSFSEKASEGAQVYVEIRNKDWAGS